MLIARPLHLAGLLVKQLDLLRVLRQSLSIPPASVAATAYDRQGCYDLCPVIALKRAIPSSSSSEIIRNHRHPLCQSWEFACELLLKKAFV